MVKSTWMSSASLFILASSPISWTNLGHRKHGLPSSLHDPRRSLFWTSNIFLCLSICPFAQERGCLSHPLRRLLRTSSTDFPLNLQLARFPSYQLSDSASARRPLCLKFIGTIPMIITDPRAFVQIPFQNPYWFPSSADCLPNRQTGPLLPRQPKILPAHHPSKSSTSTMFRWSSQACIGMMH